jgi:hypothetical protein|tara:strand:- start:50 stop:223 length:174 start_codon:yes stop_codon:yes gene_type:complete
MGHVCKRAQLEELDVFGWCLRGVCSVEHGVHLLKRPKLRWGHERADELRMADAAKDV